MLRQEVNFYRHFEAPIEQGYFTWKQYRLFTIVVIVLMVLIYQYSLLVNFDLKSQLNTNKKKLGEIAQRFDAVKKTLPAEFFSDNINNSVANLKKIMTAQQEIVSILSKHSSFSDDLLTISQTIPDGVWITEININNYGAEITLTGETLNTDALHEFIRNCEKDNNFKQYTITIHNVKEKEANAETTNATFTLDLALKS